MSNFGAEDERSYIIWHCEAEIVFKDVLNTGNYFTWYSFSIIENFADVTRKPIKVLALMVLRLSIL